MKRFFCLYLCTFALNGQAHEEILGVHTDSEGVTFHVKSNGCTTREDFGAVMLDTLPAGVLLVRNNEDRCDGYVPYGTSIKFKYEELGFLPGAEFNIVNPLATLKFHKEEKVKK